MISSGQEETNSSFVTATPSGSDVFFTTRSQLVAQDQDDLMDLYDAREPHVPGEQVGFPPESSAPECTSSEECRHSAIPSESLTAPLSTMLSGLGNLVPISSPMQPRPPLTRAQKLAKALKACRKLRTEKQRKACAAQVKRRYGAKASTKPFRQASAPRASSRSTK